MPFRAKPLPPIERLRELLTYDPESGDLRRRTSRSGMAPAGKLAGSVHHTGYLYIAVDNSSYTAHRLAWALHYGEDPGGLYIDHIDGDPSNNRIANLRLVEHVDNSRNAARSRRNTSGVTGVSWDKRAGKWRAYIRVYRSLRYLGYFDDLEDATSARKVAEREHGFHENHGRGVA